MTQSGWAQLGRHLSGREARKQPEPTLFDVPVPDPVPDEPVLVRLNGVRGEHLRDFGDVWLGWGLWRMLGLDTLFEELLPRGGEDVAWSLVAAILTRARFCEPSSELHIEDTWYRRTTLPELLGVASEQVHTDRFRQRFDRDLEQLPEPVGKARLKIAWQRRPRFGEWVALAEGCDLLRSNLTDVDAPTRWKRYIQLTEAEWAFRITKDELAIRPIWPQKQDRVRAHILVCFLAYALWTMLAGWMQRSGLGDAPRTLLEEFAKLQTADVLLPAQDRHTGREDNLRLRCITEPDDAQQTLLDRLGLTLPRRLKPLENLNHT